MAARGKTFSLSHTTFLYHRPFLKYRLTPQVPSEWCLAAPWKLTAKKRAHERGQQLVSTELEKHTPKQWCPKSEPAVGLVIYLVCEGLPCFE